MALSYQQASDLMKDPNFVGRIKIACMHYASYRGKGAWATLVVQSPDVAAANILPVVIMDSNIQNSSAGDGSDVPDATLQSAVETAVNNML